MSKFLILASLLSLIACQKNNIKIGDFVKYEKSSSCFSKVTALKDGNMADVEINGQIQTISLKDYAVCTPTQSESMKVNIGSPTTDSMNKK